MHHELQFMVASGLTPFEAIATGTTAVAKFLGTNAGSIEIGRIADLVLLDADPLADISNTRRVHGPPNFHKKMSGREASMAKRK